MSSQPSLIEVPTKRPTLTEKPKRTISFFVQGEPKPQPRARSFALRGKGGRVITNANGDPVIRVHESGTAENWKSQIALAAKDYIPFPPITGPIRMRVDFYFPRLKSHFRSNGKLKAAAPIWHTSRGDIDNLWKGTADALTVLGLWSDDAQVCDCHILKSYATEFSGAKITIQEL